MRWECVGWGVYEVGSVWGGSVWGGECMRWGVCGCEECMGEECMRWGVYGVRSV